MARKLYRSCTDRIIGGVAGGVAEYFDVDSTLVRLLFLILLFSGAGPLLYIIAWVLIPLNPVCEKNEVVVDEKVSKNNAKFIFGMLLLVFGAVLLLENIYGSLIWHFFWPTLLIVFGLILIIKTFEK